MSLEGSDREITPDSGATAGGLFQGKTFWLSQNVPQRSRFKEIIQQNGGIVKLFEKDAEIQIVDHTRKNLPPNTYSYRYVENSVRKGKLENLEVYSVGPSAARPVGATNIPSRGKKIPYSIQDDQILWDWMQPYETNPLSPISGNKLYQDLAAKFPRHTYQSYRDRYLKRLRGRPRPGGMPTTAQPSLINNETRTRSPPRPSSPTRAGQETHAADANSPRPQERKRKRSPGPEPPRGHGSSEDVRPQRNRVTAAEQAPQTTVLPILPIHRVNESRNHETTPQPTTSKKTPNSDREKNTAQELADDPESVINNLFFELPFFPQNPGLEEEVPEQDIDAWIDDRLRTGKAENEEQIIEALRCTSMDPTLADEVLRSLVAGNGIPNGMRGVWTSQDDKCVEAQDTREVQRVLEKHGSDLFNARWEYLVMARAAGLENLADDN